jgi:hypothetical protein
MFRRPVKYIHYVSSGGCPLGHLKRYYVIILSVLLSDIRTECPQKMLFKIYDDDPSLGARRKVFHSLEEGADNTFLLDRKQNSCREFSCP